jgi:hypothetical protein
MKRRVGGACKAGMTTTVYAIRGEPLLLLKAGLAGLQD